MANLNKSGLSLAHLNVCSILASNRLEMLRTQLELAQIDVIGISESWLNESIPDCLVDLKGYNLVRLDRQWNDRGDLGPKKKGGGLICYTKNNLQISDTKYSHLNCSCKDIEMQWLAVQIPNLRPIVVINAYRPPQGDTKRACKMIDESISRANLKSNAELYLLGDLNIDLLDKKAQPTKDLLFTMGSNGLQPKITSPTRFSFREGVAKHTCIDHIFTNSTLIVEGKTLDLNISDHLAVYVRRKKPRVHAKKINFTGRSYRNFVKEDYQQLLLDEDWEGFYSCINPNRCWEIMEEVIRNNLNNMCPQRKYRVKEILNPWVTNEILEEIRDKDSLMRTAKASGREEDWILAKRERNRVRKLVKDAKANFVKDQQRELKGEPKKFWKLISSIVPNKKGQTSKINLVDKETKVEFKENEAANCINSFFSNIGAQLSKNNNAPWKFYGQSVEVECPRLRTDFEEVLSLCKKINIVKSSGIDDVASKIFKCAFMVLIPQLVYLFNLSFETNLFPNKWKQATVVPLFKSGDRSEVSNYRPISLLPLPGKILEKIAHRNIVTFLEENNIISDQQNGFRKGFSTVTAVADLTDSLFSAINKSEITLSVFVDLRKAFDTVSHDILCKKIEKYGVRSNVNEWCRSYLTGRSQKTLANNNKSDECSIKYGVPQGSVLGPLFFILYVNDLQQALKNINVQMYADDTVIYLSGQNVTTIAEKLQLGLSRLNGWCLANKLTLNPSKTKMMTFGTRHSIKKANHCHLSLAGVQIQKVSTFKYLGFTLDSTLSFKMQVSDTISKIMHKKIMLSKIMPFLNNDVALLIYKSMILPYFDYCDVIYNCANADGLEKLQRLQNKCLKICLNLHQLHNTINVHREAKCAYLEVRRKVHTCNFMYKRQAKLNLLDLRDIHTRQHDAPLFKVPHPNNEAFKRSVLYYGANTWNNLPTATRLIRDYLPFKAHQKKQMNATFH